MSFQLTTIRLRITSMKFPNFLNLISSRWTRLLISLCIICKLVNVYSETKYKNTKIKWRNYYFINL